MLKRTWQRGVVSLAAALLAASAACQQVSAATTRSAGSLSVVAGRRVYDLGPGPATRASLWFPSGAAVDARGDLFIADSFNDVVEKVTPAGELSVVAGVAGKPGAPTPGPANRSELDAPTGVAADAHGDLFIADSFNDVVEKVTPAGRLSVVAGDGTQGRPTPGPATRSGLDEPTGVVVGARGDLFIADSFNNVVEEVTPSGRLSVVAGDGWRGPPTAGPATRSELDAPFGVALDARGDLFVSDPGTNVVEEVTPAGRLSVVAGVAGEAGPPTPGAAARSALDAPTGIAADARGDLFVTDSRNNVVEEVTPAGRLSVVAGVAGEAGPPTPGAAARSALDAPTGIAADARGDLFVTDSLNNVVEEVTPAGRLSVVAGVVDGSGPPTPGPAISSALADPYGVTSDASGDVFIADSGNNLVEEVTPGGELSVVAGVPGGTGAPTPGPATSSELDGPAGLTMDADGDLFIAGSGNNLVEEVTPAGRLSVVAGDGRRGLPTPGPATRSDLDEPTGVIANAEGDLFIADTGNNVVEELTPAGQLSVVAGLPGKPGAPTPGPATASELDAPTGVAADAAGTCSSPMPATTSSRRSALRGSCRSWRGCPANRGPQRQAPPPPRSSTGRRGWRRARAGTCSSPTLATMSSRRSPPPGGCRWSWGTVGRGRPRLAPPQARILTRRRCSPWTPMGTCSSPTLGTTTSRR